MTLPLLLSVYYCTAINRSGPSSTGYRNIRTSGRSTAPLHRYGLLPFAWWWIPGIPRLDLWDGIPPGISSRRVTAAALGRPQKFHRKVPGRSQQESADDDGCGPAGVIKIFKNVVLAHYLDY